MYTVIDVKYGSKDIDTDIEGDNLQTALRRYASAVACFGPDPYLDKSKMSPTEHHLSLAKEFQKNDAILLVENDENLRFFIVIDLKCLNECFTTPHTIELSEKKQGETLMVIDHQELEVCFPHASFLSETSDDGMARHLTKRGNVKPTDLRINPSKLPSQQHHTAYQGPPFAGATYATGHSFTDPSMQPPQQHMAYQGPPFAGTTYAPGHSFTDPSMQPSQQHMAYQGPPFAGTTYAPGHSFTDPSMQPKQQHMAYQGPPFAGTTYAPGHSFTDPSMQPSQQQHMAYQRPSFAGATYAPANPAMPPFPANIDPSYIEGSSSQTAFYSTGLSQEPSLQSSAYTYPAMLSNFPSCAYTAQGSRNPYASIPPPPPIAGSSSYVSVATESASVLHGEPAEVNTPLNAFVTASAGQRSIEPDSDGLFGDHQPDKISQGKRLPIIDNPDSINPKCANCQSEKILRRGFNKSLTGKDTLFLYQCREKKCGICYYADLAKFIRERSEAEINKDINPVKKIKSVTCKCKLTALIEDLKPIGIGTYKSPTQKYRCKNPKCKQKITDPNFKKAKRYLVEPDRNNFVEDPDSINPPCTQCQGEARRCGQAPKLRSRDTIFNFTCKDITCGATFTADLAKFILERSEEEINKGINPDSDKDNFRCKCKMHVSVKDLQHCGVGTYKNPVQKYKCNNPNCNATIEDPRNRKAKLYLDESNRPRSKVARLESSNFNSDQSFCRYCGNRESVIKSLKRGNTTLYRIFGCRQCQLKVPPQKIGDNFIRPTCPECGPEAKINTFRIKQSKSGNPLFQCTRCNKLIVFEKL